MGTRFSSSLGTQSCASGLGATWFVVGLLLLSFSCGGGSQKGKAGPMPTGGSYYGVWMSPQYGKLQLCAQGGTAHGYFEKDERHGKVEGTIRGNQFSFRWEEEREFVVGRPTVMRGRGYFRYQIGDDGDHYFTGRWGTDDDDSNGGEWNGVKLRRKEPEKCLSKGEESDEKEGFYGDDEEEEPSDEEQEF